MTRQRIPDAVLDAAHARARARADRDWVEADRLRAEIEGAGWKIVDRGTDFALSPAAPPDVEDGLRIRYGASRSVPSRLDEAPIGLATLVLIATDQAADLDRTVRALRAHAPAGTAVVIVADDPSDEMATALDAMEAGAGPEVEVIWTSERLGPGAATNCGIRRAAAPVVILLDPGVEAAGDIVTPLVQALDDPTVAVAGGWGVTSADVRTFEDASAGDVDAVPGPVLAFRRSDFIQRGPLDERFRTHRHLDIWWSLVLRDDGEGESPRRAVRLGDLPATRHAGGGSGGRPDGERDRQARRDFYRIFDRFGHRRDLLVRPGG